MRNSFQEQMLKLGLVDKKKVKEAKNEQHRSRKSSAKSKKKKGGGQLSTAEENALLLQQAAEKKKARDLQLNRERDARLQKRAERAQIRQLIAQHKIAKDEDGVPYRFNVSGKIYRIFVDNITAQQLGNGILGIVEMVDTAGQFEVIPKDIIERIRATDKRIFTALVSASPSSGQKDEDDPYAEYTVPDDLVW